MNAQRMDAALVAEHVAATAGADDRPFLLARVLTDQLRAHPVETTREGWRDAIATSIEAAFDADLARVATPTHRGLPPGLAPGGFARTLLVALTWAFGAGFPEDEWRAVAEGLIGVDVGRDDVSWVLDQLGRYVLQDGEAGQAVYRVAHQSLADHLRPAFRSRHDEVFDQAARPVTAALLARYRALLDAGLPASEPAYLWGYAWRHAAQAGEDGLAATQRLAEGHPATRIDVALAAGEIAARWREWGHRSRALPPAEQAVAVCRELTDHDRDLVPRLASALTALGVYYSELGRRTDALPPAEEAATIYRALAADNPAFLPDLAGALNNLGIRYSELGRRTDALPPAEEAATAYRALAADNPAFLPNLASALNNLGIRYSELGRRTDALPPAEEAATIYRALAASNPAFLPNLASALNNLGNRYSELGRRTDALPPAEEAVALRRALAADNPAFLPNLASALNNLGNHYRELGRERKIDEVWAAVLDEQPITHRSVLLLSRALSAPPGSQDAVAWLAAAVGSSGDDHPLRAALHEEARRHDDASSEWRPVWADATGQPAPGWLTVDRALLRVSQEWTATPTYSAEAQFLDAHPELLDAAADIAVEEALLPVRDADRYRTMRNTARREGVAAAYRSTLLAELAATFIEAAPEHQRNLLRDHEGDLRDEQVRALIAERAGAADATLAEIRAHGMMTLLDAGADDGLLDAAFTALAEPDQFAVLLRDTAASDAAPEVLLGLAQLALTAATSALGAGSAWMYAALAADDPDLAQQRLEQALNQYQAGRTQWPPLLLSLREARPIALLLLDLLYRTPQE